MSGACLEVRWAGVREGGGAVPGPACGGPVAQPIHSNTAHNLFLSVLNLLSHWQPSSSALGVHSPRTIIQHQHQLCTRMSTGILDHFVVSSKRKKKMRCLSGMLVAFNQNIQEYNLWAEILLFKIVLLGSYNEVTDPRMRKRRLLLERTSIKRWELCPR